MKASEGGGYRKALRHRDFRILMARYITSGIGSWAYVVALIAFVYDQTGSPTWVAAVSIVRLGPMFVLSTYAGVIAERFERTRVMLVSDLGAFVAMVGLVTVALLDAPAWVAIALAGVTSAMTIMEEPAVAALVPQVVGEEDLAAANGIHQIIDNLNVIVGPAIGAGLLVLTSAAGTFAVNAASFAVAASLVTRLRVRSTPTDVTQGGDAGIAAQLAVGIRAIRAYPNATILVGFGMLGSLLWGIDTVVFPLLGTALGLGSNGFGYLVTGLGVGGVLAGGLVNRLGKQPRLGAVIGIGILVFSIPTAVLAVVERPGTAFALQVVRGGAALIVGVLVVTALQRSLPSDMIARVFGAVLTLDIGAMVLGAAITPTLLRLLGLSTTLVVIGLGSVAVPVILIPRLIAMDRQAVQRLEELAPRIALLEELGIFADASRPVLERLAGAAERIDLPAGTAFLHEGEPADALYVLATGTVVVTAVDGSAPPRQLATLTAPSYVGEIGLLERIPRTATVESLEPTTLYRIDGETFLEALTTTPAAAAFVDAARTRLARAKPSPTPPTDDDSGPTELPPDQQPVA